jgi:hypothetical protein
MRAKAFYEQELAPVGTRSDHAACAEIVAKIGDCLEQAEAVDREAILKCYPGYAESLESLWPALLAATRRQTPTKFVQGSRTPGSQTPTPGGQTPAKFVRKFARDAGGCHACSRCWRRDDPRASGRCGHELVGGPARF